MCGLCGYVNSDPAQPADPKLLTAMTQAVAHRGPDGQCTFIRQHVGVGHRRLTIIDRSPAADQPMSNEAGTLQLIFNGEIYNYLSLRAALIQKGHTFQTHSDTEVILHLYEEYGPECVQYLQGMFAIVIWDEATETLFLARDRLGKKPLYYAHTPDRFLFASEIKSLLQDRTLPRALNYATLQHFLALGYIPGPQTVFTHVQQLPPAHTLLLRNNHTQLNRYWRLSFKAAQPDPSPQHAQLELLDQLREAVNMRLMSEAPLGVFLSGGLDSSLIVALMAQLMTDPIRTFSIRFQESSHDESTFAQQVAALFKTEHHEFTLTPDIAHLLPGVVYQFDQPFGDPSAVSTYYLAQQAGAQIRVALNGDGGDEAFGGYDRYLKSRLAASYYAQPQLLRRWEAATLRRLAPARLPNDHLLPRLAAFFQSNPTSAAENYGRWLFVFQPEQQAALLHPDFSHALANTLSAQDLIAEHFRDSTGKTATETLLEVDTHTYLPDDLLVKMDRASMASAIENRSPFLDHRLMETIAAFPASFKIRGLTRKWILKQAAASVLPKSIIHRPKRGFGIPVDRWLRGPLKPLVVDTLLSRAAQERGYFNPEVVQQLVDQHLAGTHNWQFQIWSLLVLELWHLHCLSA
jgi:asparagine synthase (glutamine-hydrolysing)